MKSYFFFLSFFILTLSSTAQRTQQYYDYQGQQVAAEKALFFSITEKDGDRFHRRVYYNREDKLQMDGYFADSNCTIKQGAFFYYYPGGNLEIECNYISNRLDARYLSFYDNGMMKDSCHYSGGNIIGNSYSWHRNGFLKDSIMRNEDGSGISVSWHQNGVPSAAGYLAADGKLRATWQFFHSNGKPSSRELYVNGKLVEKKYFHENGKEEKDTTNTDRELSFPGGNKAWSGYVSKLANFPAGWDLSNKDSIVVVVSAVIDEEGNVTNVYVSSPFHPAFDEVALGIVLVSPRWIPAIEHHRKIRTPVKLPVTFKKPG